MAFRVKSGIDTAQIEPEFFADVSEVLGQQTDLFVIHFGFRSKEEQAALRAKYEAGGPKAAKPENSAHVGENFPDGLARAVDVTLVRNNRDVWDYTDPAWVGLIGDIRAHPRLHSGADFGDEDHIEKYHYRDDMA